LSPHPEAGHAGTASQSPRESAGFEPPAGAWDCHCHVFGAHAQFPYAPERRYTPPDVPAATVMALHHALGFDHAVLVQPAAHGSDHAALLDCLARTQGRYRGIMLVDGDGAGLSFDALHRQGMRGVRYNLLPHLGALPDMGRVGAIADRIAPPGWHICVHLEGRDLDHMPAWLDLGVPIVIDHMARLDLNSSELDNQIDQLMDLLSHPQVFVKLSAADRLSVSGAPYDDGIAIARRLFAAQPEKCLWGTDFPHPNHPSPPDDATLVDLIAAIAPDRHSQRLLLIETPQKLYL